ncbi:nucleoside phosphorylase domain-containing protein [Cladorrhinum sp. PSN332]|nr:nucleoside phosphorylase domain-containing protein [Cladorrhinum sp. PSN332]
MSHLAERPRSRYDFDVAIICALPVETQAVLDLFDCFWDENGEPYGKARRDPNQYRTGRIGRDDVVLLTLPGPGKINAARGSTELLSSFPGIRLILVVGTCGGVPRAQGGSADEDYQSEPTLGDVVVSDAVIEFDVGRQYHNCFRIETDSQVDGGKAQMDILSLLSTFDDYHGKFRLGNKVAQFLEALQEKESKHSSEAGGNSTKYQYPGTSQDRLFPPAYLHRHRFGNEACGCSDTWICESAAAASCEEVGCDESQMVKHREQLVFKQKLEEVDMKKAQRPAIHIGAFASGDTMMASGTHRDMIADENNVVAFDMEAAGVWDLFHASCIVVKGVSNYADSHINKRWQSFAAATAASTAKAILALRSRPDKRSQGHLGTTQTLTMPQLELIMKYCASILRNPQIELPDGSASLDQLQLALTNIPSQSKLEDLSPPTCPDAGGQRLQQDKKRSIAASDLSALKPGDTPSASFKLGSNTSDFQPGITETVRDHTPDTGKGASKLKSFFTLYPPQSRPHEVTSEEPTEQLKSTVSHDPTETQSENNQASGTESPTTILGLGNEGTKEQDPEVKVEPTSRDSSFTYVKV